MPEYFWLLAMFLSTVGSVFSITLAFAAFLTAVVDNKPYALKSFSFCMTALALAALWGYSFAQL